MQTSPGVTLGMDLCKVLLAYIAEQLIINHYYGKELCKEGIGV